MKLYRIPKPLIAYTLCFDDAMRTYLENEGIPYVHAFGACWEFTYNGQTDDMAKAVSFPSVGFGKYESLGIQIEKKEIADGFAAFEELKTLLSEGIVVPIHYDGFYCRWDPMLKTKRWHNRHIVLARNFDKKENNLIVDDPHFTVRSKKLPVSSLGTASKFYYRVNTKNYKPRTSEEHFHAIKCKFGDYKSIADMERFLSDLKIKSECETPDWLFSEQWNLMIANGYMTRHFLWLYFRNLFSETKKMSYGFLEWMFFGELQLWNECMTHSLKGARRKNKRMRFLSFLKTFEAVIEKEKEIFSAINCNDGNKPFEILSFKQPRETNDYFNIDLTSYMNTRSCKYNKRDCAEADLTGEGEYIIPFRKFTKRIKIHGIAFPVCLGELYDGIRCEGQKIIISEKRKAKGIALLVCTEWGSSQFLFKLRGEKKEYGAQCIVEDFTDRSKDSVRAGKSYLKGKHCDKLFQKRIYFRCTYFELSEFDEITELILPVSPSIHIFSAVLAQ